ncbi:MAG: gluconate 2-dehydrogenase subunit 3 family protein [Verrucomicrobia bacterium]|nr:gluconate 2-dehydrogenase subunit 3 family protein [Verrucomicrobiota bacterium]
MSDVAPLPDPLPSLSRRTVLKLAAVGFVGGVVGLGSTAALTRYRRPPPPGYRFFTAAEGALLIEICEQLIPRDDAPGATDTGAIWYIDRQLCGRFAAQQPLYRRGLESFRLTCVQEYKKTFAELSTDEKIAALRAIEAGRAPKALWSTPTPSAFFNVVLAHTMQSFYGSPRHGGNRGFASHRMLGLDYPQLVGQNRYRST